MKPGRIFVLIGAAFVASLALSSVHPWGNLRSGSGVDEPLLTGANVPADVRQVLETKCADCHSTSTHWPVYSRFAPGSWLMEHDVQEARSHLNLSSWQQYDAQHQVELLTRIATEARSGEMPVRQYLLLHPAARLSDSEQQMIYAWAKSERKRIKDQASEQSQGAQ